MSSSGLTRRRGAGGVAGTEGESSNGVSRTNSTRDARDNGPETSYESGENGHKIAFDPRDISESAERSKQPKLTMMEEVLLLGLKDKQVCAPVAWRDAIADRNLAIRGTSRSGTTTSRTRCEDASCSNSRSAGASAWRKTRRGDGSPWQTETLKS